VSLKGYRHSKEFIVAPGPMESTSADFWRMIWENKSCSIIMLGELVENGEARIVIVIIEKFVVI